MKVCAFIPARGSSKRVPNKNLAEVGGKTLVERAINCAIGVRETVVTSVVSTDDADILGHAFECGADVVHERPPQLASDHAQIEDAISHWWRRIEGPKPDVIVLLQPTSPFRTADHVRMALALLETSGADSVIGVTAGHESHFAGRLKPRELEKPGPWGFPARVVFHDWEPLRDPSQRNPRTQDMPPMAHENGAIYAFTRAHWERTVAVKGGRMAALPMDWVSGLDIDTPEDLEVARAIAERMGR